MKAKFFVITGIMMLGVLTSCAEDLITYHRGDVKILIEKGDAWLHDFELFMGIKKKNPPQLAVWVEDMKGHYISTIYVSHKIATQSWAGNGGNRRKESLPVWCFARGIQATDGLYLPTKEEPLTDGISGATPPGSFDVKIHPVNDLKQFIVKMEFNHSTDWNDDFPKNAQVGDANYSGGKGGSGQPAVVYSATIDLNSGQKEYKAAIIGRSSPDGSDGKIIPETSSLTSALNIVKDVTIIIQ